MNWSINPDNVVCNCSGVTVEDIKREFEENPDLQDMTLEEKLEALDIGQTCDCCLEKDCDIIDTHYSEIFEEELED